MLEILKNYLKSEEYYIILYSNFIYIYNPDNKFYITLNNDLLGLIYHSYTKFNYKFLNHLATVWIETYTLDKNSYMTISTNENDITVTSNKIKNKTIHKR